MQLLDKQYDQKKYLDFLREMFDLSEFLKPIDTINEDVESFEQLGFITTADEKELPVFEIHIKPDTKLERNRVGLRNLVAKEVGTNDGALAVFVDNDNKQWRFSFISIEYELVETGVKTQQTASKRFTYLLGEGTKIRTATERFDQLNQRSTLDDLKAAFAVEALSKEFYGKLYRWYETAQTQVTFPNDEQANNHTQTSLIRLLTRLLFVWFIKEKKLINPDLFELAKLKNIIDWQQDSSFYKAILQNLFFATLNVEIKSRHFRNTKLFQGKNKDYGNQYRYRYYDLVKKVTTWENAFKQTSFLNGGLFECLDIKLCENILDGNNKPIKDEAGNKIINQQHKKLLDQWTADIRPEKYMIRMDGFSDNPKNKLEFDNTLFFNTEADLGLIDLFNQYQFTVEESTPTDVEVALDPELLGKVFENLLATYNPETKQLAQDRKATGSFYTPREIVSYMVDESLKQHFKTHIHLDEKIINNLFIEGENELKEAEIQAVIKAIDDLKILDPAVGSGAFPMGILQRLVFILEKIDPENKHFKQQQLDKTQTMEEVSKKASIDAIEQIFSQKNQHNAYGKKLMLIENCIYGVDIQLIAIQICKLRFFISLTIEQNSNNTSPNNNSDDNYGIKALPNLETKFIVANTLLPLGGSSSTGQMGLFDTEITKLQQNLAEVRHQYFSAKTLQTKRKYRDKDKDLREKMLVTLTQSGISPAVEKSMQKVVAWDLYNQNSKSDWFDPEWMFGIKDGFDIVLGNPPYAQVKRNIYSKSQFPYSEGLDKGKQNLYKLFTEQSYNLCKNKGVATMIVQSSLMCDLSATATRQLLLDKTYLQHIIEFPKTAKTREKQVFDSVTQGTCIYQFVKQSADNCTIDISINNDSHSIKSLAFLPIDTQTIKLFYPSLLYFPKIAIGNTAILQKIINNKITEPLLKFVKSIRKGDLNLGTDAKQFSTSITSVKLMRGRHVERYKIKYEIANEYIVKGFRVDKVRSNQENSFLISQEVTGTNDMRRLHFSLKDDVDESVLWGDSVNKTLLKDQTQSKYFLALLNSKFMDWYFRITSSNNHVQGYELKQLPILLVSITEQQPFINLASKIIIAKKAGKDTTDLEAKIDKLVYQLYNLTPAEIEIIEHGQ